MKGWSVIVFIASLNKYSLPLKSPLLIVAAIRVKSTGANFSTEKVVSPTERVSNSERVRIVICLRTDMQKTINMIPAIVAINGPLLPAWIMPVTPITNPARKKIRQKNLDSVECSLPVKINKHILSITKYPLLSPNAKVLCLSFNCIRICSWISKDDKQPTKMVTNNSISKI